MLQACGLGSSHSLRPWPACFGGLLLRRKVKRFRGGLVFEAHRLLYHSTLGLRVINKKKVASCFRIRASKGGPHGRVRPFHQKSTRLHTINFRASSYLNFVTSPPKFGGPEFIVLHRVVPPSWIGRGKSAINLRTTTSQKCAAVPRRARI